MIISNRVYWWDKDPNETIIFDPDVPFEEDLGSFYAAFFHDLNVVLIVIGIFVEGFRVC